MVESPVRANEPLKKIAGIFNELELYPDRLVLRHTDLLSRLFGHEEVIPLQAVRAVHVHPAQFITSGFLQLLVTGHQQPLGLAYHKNNESQAYDMQAAITASISSREVVPILREL